VKESKLEKALIALGDRDPRTGDYAVKSGLAEGDKVIRYPTSLLKDGQLVQSGSAPTTENTATTATAPAKGS
jgi:hypothetical protein